MESTYIGLPALKARAREAIKIALVETGDLFLAEVHGIEPEKTTSMEESTQITPVMGGGASWWRRLAVGRYYGIWQHEKEWYHHSHGRAKFVSGPFVAASARLRISLAKAAARLF